MSWGGKQGGPKRFNFEIVVPKSLFAAPKANHDKLNKRILLIAVHTKFQIPVSEEFTLLSNFQ